MSHIQVFTFTETESRIEERMQNAWLWSASIWRVLCEKYLNENFSVSNRIVEKKTWNLIDDKRLEQYEKEVLLLTMDSTLVKKENLDKLKKSLESFRDSFDSEDKLLFKDMIKWIGDNKNRPDFIAVGLHGNSISCEQWFDYNLSTGDYHNFLYGDEAIIPYYK